MRHNLIDRFYYRYLSLLSTASKTIIRNLKKKKFEPEVEILNKIVKPGDVCLDVGAAYGRYALPLSLAAGKNGRVFCFEPGGYSWRVISIIKRFHRLKNVSIHKIALCDKSGLTNLCAPLKKTGKIGASLAFISEVSRDDAVCEQVRTDTLDAFCLENKVGRVSFIKCDTEGSELAVFRGAQDTIGRYRPAVLSEVDAGNMHRYGYRAGQIEEFFKGYNYKIFSYKNGGFNAVKELAENGNYFFLPDERVAEIIN